jgi:HlyD family secretion protein
MRYFSLFLFSSLFLSCKEKKDSYIVHPTSITQSVYASGIIKSEGQYQVFPKSSGVIAQVLIAEGEIVNSGSILMKIENEIVEFNQALSTVNAQFNDKKNNNDKLEELYQNIKIAEKKLKTDSLLFIRQKNLWQQGIGSQLEYEQRELSYDNARSNFKSIRLRYSQLNKQVNLLDKQSEYALKISQTQSNDRSVKSQISGIVYSVLKKEGEMVTPQTPVAIIGSDKEYHIELNVDETDITKIKIGQPVAVSMESYPETSFEAKITKIYPIMNERTKTFVVIATFIKSPPNLYPNLSLEANILISKKERALLVPLNYLSNENELTLISGEKRKVRIGIKNFEMAEIIDGIKEGEEIAKPTTE